MQRTRLLTKEQVQKHIQSIHRRYTVHKYIDSHDAFVCISKKGFAQVSWIARIDAEAFSESVFIVENAATKRKGLGKYLYYMLMDLVFPACVVSDREDLSDSALRVWKVLEKADYVQTGIFYDADPENNSSIGCYNKTAKFSLESF